MKNTKTPLRCIALATISIASPLSYAATVSDLLITEVMANPSVITDGNGEWFELFNPTNETVDLNGLTLMDDGSNNHTISVEGGLIINPGDYFVLARNGNVDSNGGVNADYIYSGFTLGNSSDQIIFSDGINELLRLDYDSSPEFAPNGFSMELIDSVMLQGNYAQSSSLYNLDNYGTPGAMGSFDHSPSPVPLPASVWLMGSGFLGLLGISRRSRV